jgi:hypothetical protein
MVIWNLLDGGPSCKGHLLGSSESMRGGIPGNNPRQWCYIQFLRFWKISSFDSKHKAVRLWFYQKMHVRDKNWLKIHIWYLWDPYSCSVRHYGVVHKFFMFSKISSFDSKPKRLAFDFTNNPLFKWNGLKSIFLSLWCPYSCSVRHYDVVHNFLRFWKISSFRRKNQWV